jgi:hypothetical protein
MTYDRYLAWASTTLMYLFGPCAGVVAGMAVQQRIQHDAADEAAIQWASDFGQTFITLRLWLFVVFISQFAVSLLFLTIQLFAVESHLNFLLAKRCGQFKIAHPVHFQTPLESVHLMFWHGAAFECGCYRLSIMLGNPREHFRRYASALD